MNKEIIMNTYAISNNYDSWYDLVYSQDEIDDIVNHYNIVIGVIQRELLKQVSSKAKVKCIEVQGSDEYIHDEFIVDTKSILNLDIL